MNRTNLYPLLLVLAACLSTPAFGDLQLIRPSDVQPSRPYGALSRIDTVDFVHLTIISSEPNEYPWTSELHSKIRSALRDVSGKPTARSSLDISYNIRVEIFRLPDVSNSIIRVESSLWRSVHLDPAAQTWALANVWSITSPMQLVSRHNLPDATTKTVMDQAEQFLTDFHKANPPSGQQQADMKQLQPISAGSYIASKNSQIFHKSDCRFAKRITQGNLVGYDSREQAVKAGKKPCTICKP